MIVINKKFTIDLVEEFRQQIFDKSILKLINRNQIEKDDFEKKDGRCIIMNHAENYSSKQSWIN